MADLMDPLSRILALLKDESPRKRIAAAVVLGELGVRSPAAISALSQMARDSLAAIAEPALEALGKLGARGALPVLLEALERKELRKTASEAIAALGEDALLLLRERAANAAPEVRAALSQLLPAVRGSFAMVLDGLRGQPWEAVSKVALSVRQSARAAPLQERKAMATKVVSFLRKAKDHEPALRGAIKILGYLELPESAKTLQPYLGRKSSAAVRVEAIMALRFALGEKPAAKALRTLIDLLEDPDSLVARAARDTLTVARAGDVLAKELVRLAGARDADLALWAVGLLGAAGASKELAQIARGGDRARAEAAVKALAALPGTGPLLVAALADAKEEAGAHALAEALERFQLSAKEIGQLRKAGAAMLRKSLAVARRQLEPVRHADPQGWAKVLREAAGKADPTRAEAVRDLLVRSPYATDDDRYAEAALLLRRSSLDPHPRARHSDAALVELEKLAAGGFALAGVLEKDRKISEEARYYVGFHFAEHAAPEVRAQGVTLLEGIASGGRGKLARAARNKLGLLRG
jgi:HEAT repeat protein